MNPLPNIRQNVPLSTKEKAQMIMARLTIQGSVVEMVDAITGRPVKEFYFRAKKEEIEGWLDGHPTAIARSGGKLLWKHIEPVESPRAAEVVALHKAQAEAEPEPEAESAQTADEPEGQAEEGSNGGDKSAKPEAAPSTGAAVKKKHRAYKIPPKPKGAERIEDYIGQDGSIQWADWKKNWNGLLEPKPSCTNARIAILALRIDCAKDVFHDRLLVGGHIMLEWAGEFSDEACQMLRVIIKREYGFDPGRDNVHDAVVQLCIQNQFDPVIDYLNGLEWDGKPRLDKWLVQYLGADNTELNRAIGRLALIAAIRRARQPGCKFDQIIVLEGMEGTQKSTTIAVMAGEDNFSDQTILGLDDRTQAERVKGKWLYEIADLAGMRRAEVETVKAFASRTHDRARPAYGRAVVDQPRRCVFFATTNTDDYLKSQTGNRRFWPVKTGVIDIETLRRDRDQLWAEAAAAEAKGESIVLPKHLWSKARVEQDNRLEHDPWDDILEAVKGEVHKDIDGDEERIASNELLLNHLKIPAERATKEAERKLAQCMRRLGWQGPKKMRLQGCSIPIRGYWRAAPSQSGAAGVGRSPPWKREK